MHKLVRQGDLLLNGLSVGTVVCEGITDGWGFGKFVPGEDFESFAPIFGVWSLLIHEDDGKSKAPREALEELAKAEMAIDRIHAELRWLDSDKHTQISQLNIDGPLIEWKPG